MRSGLVYILATLILVLQCNHNSSSKENSFHRCLSPHTAESKKDFNLTRTTLASRGAFYFWQVRAPLPGKQELRNFGVDTLYVRYFDVTAGKSGPRPVGIRKTVKTDAVVIPVVYITVSALKGLNEKETEELARNIWKLIQKIGFTGPEIQIDCDWTPSTRRTYFALLENIRKAMHSSPDLTLSATIRLHQLKYYRRTGIPPVDRGAVMIYNMGDLSNPEESNSIFRADLAKQYLDGKWLSEYPLPLDIAMPDFQWGVAFLNGSFHSLVHGITEAQLQKNSRKSGSNNYSLEEEFMWDGQNLPAGTRIRMEKVDVCERWQVLELIAGRLADDPVKERRIIVFDYNSKKTESEIQELVDLFRISGVHCNHESCIDGWK
ncbi:MAG: hypothetical protein RH862_11305 [Leptospiraceae bacterium]